MLLFSSGAGGCVRSAGGVCIGNYRFFLLLFFLYSKKHSYFARKSQSAVHPCGILRCVQQGTSIFQVVFSFLVIVRVHSCFIGVFSLLRCLLIWRSVLQGSFSDVLCERRVQGCSVLPTGSALTPVSQRLHWRTRVTSSPCRLILPWRRK